MPHRLAHTSSKGASVYLSPGARNASAASGSALVPVNHLGSPMGTGVLRTEGCEAKM